MDFRFFRGLLEISNSPGGPTEGGSEDRRKQGCRARQGAPKSVELPKCQIVAPVRNTGDVTATRKPGDSLYALFMADLRRLAFGSRLSEA